MGNSSSSPLKQKVPNPHSAFSWSIPPAVNMSDPDAIDHLSELPLELLYSVLLELDLPSLLRCRLLNKFFCDIISNVAFWHQVSQQSLGLSKFSSRSLWISTADWDWRLFAMLSIARPFNRNLIKNGSAELMKEHEDAPNGKCGRTNLFRIPHWQVPDSGGDGWQVERPPYGAQPVPHHEDIVGGGCFVTSYCKCSAVQLVQLEAASTAAGRESFMDSVRPDIAVSEWVCGRHDCLAKYVLRVRLLDAAGKTLEEWKHELEVGAGSDTYDEWTQVRHVFTEYPPGVRSLEFYHQGQDKRFWAGWYGAKTTGASVRLLLPPPPDSAQ